MPQIVPMIPEGTIAFTQNTMAQSAKSPIPGVIAPPTEPISPPSTPEAPKPDDKRLKALLFKERQFQSQRRKMDEERKAFLQEKEGLRSYMEAKELAKSNKLDALAKLGITYDDLTQQIINNGQVPPAQLAAQAAQDIVTKELEAFKKAQEETTVKNQQRQYEQAVTMLRNEAKHITAQSEKYPLVKEAEAYDDIVKEIEAEFHRTGRMVPVEEMLNRWEALAREGLEELDKIIRPKVAIEEKPQTNQTISQPITLTQRALAPTPSPRPMSDAERKQKAIEAFYGRS